MSDKSVPVRGAIILAGGRGRRLAPYTTVLPKPLMPVGEMPVLEILLRQLVTHGVGTVTLCVGYLSSLLEAYFGDGSRWGLSITYSRETEPLGTAGPLTLLERPSGPVLVMNGDLLTTVDFSAMCQSHVDRRADCTVGVVRREVPVEFGVIEMSADALITDYVEKPVLAHDVSMGVYVLEPAVFDHIPSGKASDLPDLVLRLIERQMRVVAYRSNARWLDIGRQQDYELAGKLFAEHGEAYGGET